MPGDALTLRLSHQAVNLRYARLAAISVVFVAATLLSDLKHPFMQTALGRELDLKLEANVAVWWSSIMLFIAGMAACGLSRAVRPLTEARWSSKLWLLMGLFFLALSADETASMHERTGKQFIRLFGAVPWLTNAGYTWLLALLPLIIVFAACVVVVAHWTLRWHRPGALLLLGGLASWLGVLVAEFVQALLVRWSLPRGFQGVVEEGLEIVGANLFIVGLVELLWVARQRADKDRFSHASEHAPVSGRSPMPE